MRFAIVVCALAVAACSSQDEATPEEVPETQATAEPLTPTIPPPQREELAAAWAEACPEKEPANKGLCKSKGFGDPDFTCDFALGEDEYRRYTAELTTSDGKWVLAEPDKACAIVE